MPRIYTVSFTQVATTAQVDFFEITPADDKPVEVFGLFLSQTSDAGDAQDELMSVQVIRGFTVSGSGGSAPTPAKVDNADAAAGFAAETNNTTLANTGSTVTLLSDAFNVRAGYQLWLPEGAGFWCSQASTSLVVRNSGAPADSLTMNGTLFVREYGG